MTYLLYLIGSLFLTVLCYITNPIVVLFCDEEGELHGFWRYWQTWDDSCDAEYYMHYCVPKILDYNYDSKYVLTEGTTPELEKVGRTRLFSKLIPGVTFSIKERIQRYLCRVLWLTRNNAYGFHFWYLGAPIVGTKLIVKIDEPDVFYATTEDGKYWMYKNDSTICKIGPVTVKYKTFIGWKMNRWSDTSSVYDG